MSTASTTPASIYVDVASMPWEPTRFPGISTKTLLRTPDGLWTALFRWEPGSELPLHEHTDIEQTYVLEGYLEDEHGRCTAGNYVWRPAGSRHVARAPEGALLLAVLLRPNRFIDGAGP